MVSAGLGRDGGGRAAAGRLIAEGIARYVETRGLGFDVLSLGAPSEPRFTESTRHFAGSRAGLAAAALAAQGPETALVFDLLGLSRIEAPLPKALRPRYLICLFGIEVWRPLSWAHRRALHGASLLAAISRHTLERAAPYTGPLPQARLLPLTLEAEPQAANELAGLPPGYLLMVGRMAASERYKGHDLMLEALPAVIRSAPETRVVLAGDGDDRPRLESRARDLGLSSHVTFTGFVADSAMRSLYRNAAIFVLPSTGEGFGLVYLEAMREGVPCVAARGSVAEEVFASDGNGVLVSPTDPAELATTLVGLLANAEQRRRIGEAGRARFEAEYTRDRFRHHLGSVLDELIGRAPVEAA